MQPLIKQADQALAGRVKSAREIRTCVYDVMTAIDKMEAEEKADSGAEVSLLLGRLAQYQSPVGFGALVPGAVCSTLRYVYKPSTNNYVSAYADLRRVLEETDPLLRR